MTAHRLAIVGFAAATTLAVAPGAEARPRPSRGRPFSANKTFGLGIMLGAPTGLSGKYFLSSDTALDFGLGVNRGWRYHRGTSIHMDFLWHPINLLSAQPFHMPLYIGIGGRVLTHDGYRDDYDDDTHVGVRVPFGLALDFNNVPLDIFFELALVADLLVDDDHNNVDFDGAVGVRFWF